MRIFPILIGLLLITVLITTSASALVTNNSANTAYYSNNVTLISGSFVHDANYIPKDYVILMALFGIIFWILAVASPICQDLFSIITPIIFGVSSWFAGYMTTEQMAIVTTGTTIYPVHTQIITPEPILQLIFLALTILSTLSAIYIIFFASIDQGLKRGEPDTSKL